MKQKKHSIHKDILFILISTFVVVVAWVGFNLYHIWITSTISEEIQMQLTPIDGSFDMQTLQKIKNREQVNPVYERATIPSQAVPTPTTQLQPSPSGAALPEPEPTAAVTIQPNL